MKSSFILTQLFLAVFLATGFADSLESEALPKVSKFKSKQLTYGHRFSLNGVTKRTHMEKAKIAGRSDIMKSGRAPANARHSVIFACKTNNINRIELILLDISNPNSKNYGQYLSPEEIARLTTNEAAHREINKYLDYHGIQVLKTSRNKEFITAEAPVSKWEEVFGNEFHLFKQTDLEDVHLVRAEEYSLPDILLEHVDAVFNVVQFPGILPFFQSILFFF